MNRSRYGLTVAISTQRLNSTSPAEVARDICLFDAQAHAARNSGTAGSSAGTSMVTGIWQRFDVVRRPWPRVLHQHNAHTRHLPASPV
ncbi:MAG TPA: hypothetical protein VE733_14785 [Streptosporangiaceae bacterium]|nr:hypothetical protein [Streptosporangiaceae bacterium]